MLYCTGILQPERLGSRLGLRPGGRRGRERARPQAQELRPPPLQRQARQARPQEQGQEGEGTPTCAIYLRFFYSQINSIVTDLGILVVVLVTCFSTLNRNVCISVLISVTPYNRAQEVEVGRQNQNRTTKATSRRATVKRSLAAKEKSLM